MAKWIVFGEGGFCETCDPSHEHPANNILSETEIPDE